MRRLPPLLLVVVVVVFLLQVAPSLWISHPGLIPGTLPAHRPSAGNISVRGELNCGAGQSNSAAGSRSSTSSVGDRIDWPPGRFTASTGPLLLPPGKEGEHEQRGTLVAPGRDAGHCSGGGRAVQRRWSAAIPVAAENDKLVRDNMEVGEQDGSSRQGGLD